MIPAKRINISDRTGAYLRWYFNGWHHFMFSDRYEIKEKQETLGVQVEETFSNISRVEVPTSKRVRKYIQIGHTGLTESDYEAIRFLLMTDTVEMYINGFWYKLDIDRGTFAVRRQRINSFFIVFNAEILGASNAGTKLIQPPPTVIDPEIPELITTSLEDWTRWDGGEPLNWEFDIQAGSSISQGTDIETGESNIVFTMGSDTENIIRGLTEKELSLYGELLFKTRQEGNLVSTDIMRLELLTGKTGTFNVVETLDLNGNGYKEFQVSVPFAQRVTELRLIAKTRRDRLFYIYEITVTK